jgi:microcystin-dependent protein
LYSYNSADSPGENILYSGIAINPTTNELNPIVCLGDAKLMVGSFQYKRTGSDRHGEWLDSGIGTEQVRSNTGFANFTPVLSNSDGSQRAVANTMKDVFAGIDVKLGVLNGMLSGSASTIQDGANNTVEFVNSSQEVIYSFAKPEPMISSPSILIFQSEASAKLDTDSPIAQAINAAVTKDGKGLSTKDYEDGDQTRLQAQAAIMSVSNANGLTLNNGVLSLSNFLDKVYPVGSIYKTTAFSTKEAVQAQFGGTWEVFGTGRVLVGISSSETEFDAIVETGGAKTVTLATGNLPAHTHSIPARTTGTESADHTHNIGHSHTYKGYSSLASGTGDKHLKARYKVNGDPADYAGEAYNGSTGGVTATHTHTTPTSTTGSAGSGTPTAITNLQPYEVVYQYRRTN